MMLSNNYELWRPPFLYNIGYEHFPAFVALGMLFIIPDIINSFKQILGVKDAAIGFNLGTFFGGVGAAWGGAQTGMGMFSSFAQTPFIGAWLHQRARKDDQLGKVLKGILGPSQAELFAEELTKRGIGKP